VFSPTTSTKSKRPREIEGSTSTTTSIKRKKEEVGPPTRIQLTNWWKVTNCVTGSATCSGITESGFVVSPAFPNQELDPNSEIPGEGNVIYVLGNHSTDADQIADNFGPWPAKMSGLNAVHLQFRSLLSESITEFSTRLAMNVNGTRLDHLSSGMLLFNTLKLLNATEVRKTLKKSVEVSQLCSPPATSTSPLAVSRALQVSMSLHSLQRSSTDWSMSSIFPSSCSLPWIVWSNSKSN
jgi:hypothetical protein